MRFFFSFIFWTSIVFLFLFLWTVSFGQWCNLEFRDTETRNHFYNIVFDVTPLAVLATLFGTIRKQHSRLRTRITIFGTLCAFVFTSVFLLSQMFTLGFGSWTTTELLYRHASDSNKRVLRQQYDAGALGYGSERTVVVQPRLFFFNRVTTWDSIQQEHGKWQPVNRPMPQLP
jgi:hypothetical protein